jgi:hypothetical protein
MSVLSKLDVILSSVLLTRTENNLKSVSVLVIVQLIKLRQVVIKLTWHKLTHAG